MARLVELRDECGAVYVEFLIAFFPLFLLFLGVCQLALIAAAETVVRHAAYSGVRTAIVVLEADPKKFDNADRGYLRKGRASKIRGLDDVVEKLGISRVAVERAKQFFSDKMVDGATSQQGARMVPIKTAALLPLLPLSPNEALVREQSESVRFALNSTSDHQLGFALEYTKSAGLVTVLDSPQSETNALDPIALNAPVTVKVAYLFHCSIPIVRAMLCSTLRDSMGKDLSTVAVKYKTAAIFRTDARFKLLTATATLPNQGAAYEPRSAK